MPLPFEPSVSDFERLHALFNRDYDDPEGSLLTQLHLAAFNGDLNLVNKLLKNGVDVNSRITFEGVTPIFCAISKNHVKVVRSLIKANADVNFRSEKGSTPLISASEGGRFEIAKMLIENGADLDARTIEGNTALHLTAHGGHVELMNFLLEKGMEINAKNVADMRPLHFAIVAGQIKAAKNLVNKGAQVNVETINSGLFNNVTPLILAAQIGSSELVILLLNAGADIERGTGASIRPLHMACKENFSGIVKILLGRNCDVNCKDRTGSTPLHIASDNGNKAIVCMLLKDERVEINSRTQQNSTPLHLAALKGHIEIIKVLVTKGAEVSAKDSEGSTPLHIAFQFSNQEVCYFLIKNGASLNSANNKNWTPLHEACYSGFSLDLVKQLVEEGSSLNAKSKDEKSAMHFATESNHPEILEFLIGRGADVNVFDSSGWNPLHVGVNKDNFEVVNFLVKKVSDINAKVKCGNGETALHFAVKLNLPKVAETLLENGADVNAQLNFLLTTPFHLAADQGLSKIAELLLKYNVNVNLKDKEGRTPLHCSVAHLHVSLVRQLLQYGADVNARIYPNINGRLDGDFTPLHLAARAGRSDVTKALLKRGAFFDAKSTLGFVLPIDAARDRNHTPLIKLLESIGDLFASVINNDVDNIKHCIERGAIVNARNSSGRTPLHYAIFHNNFESMYILLDHQADTLLVTNKGNTPLHTAVSGSDFDLIEVLLFRVEMQLSPLELLTLINAKTTGKGTTMLHMAAEMNDLSLVKLFLAYGAVYNIRNNDAKTPLQLSSNNEIKNLLNQIDELFKSINKYGHKEALELSSMEEDFVNARDSEGCTLLHLSVSKGLLDNAISLINQFADCTLVNQAGETPLHLAAAKGNSAVVKAILAHSRKLSSVCLSAILNLQTLDSGSSALHLASSKNVAQTLLQYGAIYDLKDKNGLTPHNFTKYKSVQNLLQTVEIQFKSVESGNSEFIEKISCLEAEEFESVTNAKNGQGQTLLQVLQSSTLKSMLNRYEKIVKKRKNASQP